MEYTLRGELNTSTYLKRDLPCAKQSQLFFRLPSKGGCQTESNVNTPCHIALETLEACAPFEQRGGCPSKQSIHRQTTETQDRIQAPKQEKLPGDGPTSRVNK